VTAPRWNASDIHYGLTQIRDRPEDIPRRQDPRWTHLSTYASERLRDARQGLHEREPQPATQVRLCRFWGDLSRQVVSDGLRDLVAEVMQDLDCYEFIAAGFWMDGRWHHNGVVMARLLWHLQCPDHVVSAALDLHRRVTSRATVDEDHSWQSGRHLLSLL
jgi:hypothetical protein